MFVPMTYELSFCCLYRQEFEEIKIFFFLFLSYDLILKVLFLVNIIREYVLGLWLGRLPNYYLVIIKVNN